MRNQSLKHERSGKINFNRSASDLDISVHSASPEGHLTTESSFTSSASNSKKTLECMSTPNDNDRELGDFHVDSEKGNLLSLQLIYRKLISKTLAPI